MAKAKSKKQKKEDLLDNEMQEIINNTSENGVTLFNQHRVLLDKGKRNLLVCKQHDANKISSKSHEWVKLDAKTTVLRKIT